MKKLFILFIVVAGFGVSSYGQETGKATANLVAALTIAKSGDGIINFGSIRQGTAGTVTVAGTSAALRGSTGVTLVGSTSASAGFTITGTTGAAYTVTLPASAVVSNGTKTIPVDNFSCDVVTSGASVVGVSATSTFVAGTNTFYVGATLNIVGDEPVGIYNAGATFPITVAYN